MLVVVMVKGVKLDHCAKFCGSRSNHCWGKVIFPRWRPSASLDL